MLKKLQIKLLSNSGELLNLVTCHAGQVSVFRGASPSEIRPYQRALTGSAGRERFSISLDGSDFVSDNHNLVGFGEPAPHHGMSVREFLHHSGFLEGSIEGILISYGLAHVGDALCDNLPQDEERRIRLISATNSPDKILIANEPFEPIATTWRERFAELLLSFARSRKGMVVVTSLSHRPECWIDNESIARIEVGQTAQRTIGFRTQDSNNANFVKQLREMQGDEEKVRQLLEHTESGASSDTKSSTSAHAIASAAIGTTTFAREGAFEAPPGTRAVASRFPFSAALLTTLGGLSIAAVGALYMTRQPEPLSQTAALAPTTIESATSNQTTPTNQSSTPAPDSLDRNSKLDNSKTDPSNVSSATSPTTVASGIELAQQPQPKLVLDEYPDVIRVSLLQTARGILSSPQDDYEGAPPAAAPTTARPAQTGNLFTLLQGASSKESGENSTAPESYQPSPESDPEQYQDAEERREAIRQKFLEAIRSAAENRER
jgi:ABC-type multidrug transport system ATPase subunit